MTTRAGRLEWWFTFVVVYGLYLQGTEFLSRTLMEGANPLWSAFPQSRVLLALAQAASLAVALAVQRHISVRRARDLDVRPISFWPYAATSVVTFAIDLGISFFGGPLPFHPAWIWAPPVVAFSWTAIELGARPGNPRENRWGPVPEPPFAKAMPRADNYKPPRI